MNNSKLMAEITYHEGRKDVVYKDSEGYLTAGVGHLLPQDPVEWPVGKQVTFRQIDDWLNEDIGKAIAVAKKWLGESVFNAIDEERQRVLVSFCFNLGFGGVSQFVNMKAALMLQRYDLAANLMQNSKWYTQVARRGVDMVAAMRTGVINYPK